MEDLISAYYSFNGSEVEILQTEPTPLEFIRFVSKNRPFIVRGAILHWPACQWKVAYLAQTLGDQMINVATTPYGNADSVVDCHTGKYFVKPLEEKTRFSTFVKFLQEQESQRNSSGYESVTCVKYAQSQNDNMRSEYSGLLKDIEPDISWAHVALQVQPDAINLWIGNSYSVTDLHKDHYENIYCQVLGKKKFILLPPFNHACVNEQMLPVAHYHRQSERQGLDSREVDGEGFDIMPDATQEAVPCATWDPDVPYQNITQFSHLCTPLRVELDAGDILYLPALWYHKVSQLGNEEGICCSLNYWYDMDFQSPLAPAFEYIRHVVTRTS